MEQFDKTQNLAAADDRKHAAEEAHMCFSGDVYKFNISLFKDGEWMASRHLNMGPGDSSYDYELKVGAKLYEDISHPGRADDQLSEEATGLTIAPGSDEYKKVTTALSEIDFNDLANRLPKCKI